MVRQLSLFSENEFMEDISTKDLRYCHRLRPFDFQSAGIVYVTNQPSTFYCNRFLLTEYYLGELFLKRVTPDRLADLNSGKVWANGLEGSGSLRFHILIQPIERFYHD